MNDDALAAVAAAAQLLLAQDVPQAPAVSGTRWKLAARMRTQDAGQARLVARFGSRWSLSRRLRE